MLLKVFKFRCKDIAFYADTKFYSEDFTKKLRKNKTMTDFGGNRSLRRKIKIYVLLLYFLFFLRSKYVI